jgi:hypothetical protein
MQQTISLFLRRWARILGEKLSIGEKSAYRSFDVFSFPGQIILAQSESGTY